MQQYLASGPTAETEEYPTGGAEPEEVRLEVCLEDEVEAGGCEEGEKNARDFLNERLAPLRMTKGESLQTRANWLQRSFL